MRVSDIEKATKKDMNQLPDNSWKYRSSVRIVLAYLGLESNMGNYRKWDKFIDWIALAESLVAGIRVDENCSVCGAEDNVMIQIIATGKIACTKCWCKVQK